MLLWELLAEGGAMTADVAGRRLVIFDFDGTLANTVPTIVSTARTVLARHGLTDEAMGDLTRLVGPPFPQAYSLVYGFSEEEAAQITAEYRAIYRGIGPEAWPLFDGVAALLRRLRSAGRLTAVASSKQMAMVELGHKPRSKCGAHPRFRQAGNGGQGRLLYTR